MQVLPVKEAIQFTVNAFQRSWSLFLITFFLYFPLEFFLRWVLLAYLDDIQDGFIDLKSFFYDYRFLIVFAISFILLILTYIIKCLVFALYDKRFNIFKAFEFVRFFKYFLVKTLFMFVLSIAFWFSIISGLFILIFFGFAEYDVIYRHSSLINSFKNSVFIIQPVLFSMTVFYFIVFIIEFLAFKYFGCSLADYAIKSLFLIFLTVLQAYLYRYLLDLEFLEEK